MQYRHGPRSFLGVGLIVFILDGLKAYTKSGINFAIAGLPLFVFGLSITLILTVGNILFNGGIVNGIGTDLNILLGLSFLSVGFNFL